MADERLRVADAPLPGLKLVERVRLGDERGFLSRLFDDRTLAGAGFDGAVRQINHSFTARAGTIRGLHFQHPPHAEHKLVGVLRGEILDVAVDLRAGSPTFLRWHGERLSAENGRSLLIPRGFAHGFQTLTPDCELIYLHTASYEPSAEGGLHPLDPALAIAWPLPFTEMSARDRGHPPLDGGFSGIAS